VWCAWSIWCESESRISGAHVCGGQQCTCFRCQGVVCVLVFSACEAVVDR
jgi:hypothetical protein